MQRAVFKRAEVKEGFYQAFYSHATNRVHKKFPLEGVFQIYKNQSGGFMCRLMDQYEILVVEDFLHHDIRPKLFDDEGFTIDRWDIKCSPLESDKPSSARNLAESTLTMTETFTPASRLHPYRRRSPLLKRSPLMLRNIKAVDSEDGYFQTYADKENAVKNLLMVKTDSDGDSESQILQCQQCMEILELHSAKHWNDCVSHSQVFKEFESDAKESLFWFQSVVEKAAIPKLRLLELVQQYPNDDEYLAGVFDGFILGGHRLVGIEDKEFVKIVKCMKQM